MTCKDKWLRDLGAARKGGVTLYAHRNTAYETTIGINADMTGSTLRGQVRLMPDSPSLIVEFTIAGPTIVGGETVFEVSLTEAQMASFPSDTDGNGQERFYFDFLLTPSGGTEELLFGGEFIVLGGVTQ